MTQQNQDSESQPASLEEVLAYPFPLADHSLDLADPTIYERLQAACLDVPQQTRNLLSFCFQPKPLDRRNLPRRSKLSTYHRSTFPCRHCFAFHHSERSRCVIEKGVGFEPFHLKHVHFMEHYQRFEMAGGIEVKLGDGM